MTDQQYNAKKDHHNILVSNYLKKILENEDTSSKLKAQVGDIRKRFHDILEQSSTYEDSTCCYELVTSPVYAKYLASWESEEGRKLGSPEHGKDLYQLQSIVEKQNNEINKLQKQVMDMRECFQIMLHNLAKDKDNARIVSDYLVNTCPEIQTAEPNRRTRNNAYANEELQSLRNENEVLRAKLQTIRDNADSYNPSLGTVYNFYSPVKEVLIQSTKAVCIGKGNLTSTESSSCTTLFSSSSNSSPAVYRTRKSDDHEQQKVKLLETERWTQNIPKEQRSPLLLDNQVTDETQPKPIRGSVVQEEIAITTVEYRGCRMVDLREEQADQPQRGCYSQTVACLAELEQISETVHEKRENTTDQIKEKAPQVSKAVLSISNDSSSAKYPARGRPDGSSLSTDSPPGTSALLGMLFTGFCDINAMENGRDTIEIDLNIVPSTFLEVLKRIRLICRSDYGKLFQELGVEPVNLSKPQSDVCKSEQICNVTAMTDSYGVTYTVYGDVDCPIRSHDVARTCSVDVAVPTGFHDVTSACSGCVDAPACSYIETELRMLNKVVQHWLKEQWNEYGRDTLPHMKMIKILNCYQRHAHMPLVH